MQIERKINLKTSVVDSDLAFSRLHVNSCYRCFPSTDCIDNFHWLLELKFDFFWLLCRMRVLCACIDIQVGVQLTAQPRLWQHPLYCFLNKHDWGFFHQHSRSSNPL